MIWIILGIVLFVIILGFFLFLYYVYRKAFYSPAKWQNKDLDLSKSINYQGLEERAISLINNLLAIPYEDVYINSFDGLKLHGYFYKCDGSKEVAIMFHGYRGTARRDFSGGAIEMMKLNKNVLLVDHRAHGLSEGHTITFGKREQRDVVSWINFVKERLGENLKICIVGISMGGATVLMSSDKIDPEIKIIADCPYSSIKDEIKETLRKHHLSPTLLWPFTALASIVYGHTKMNSDALDNVSRSKNKILIIHGTSDTIVPHKMSERVYLKNKHHVQYELFEGVEHGLSYIRDTERYRKLIIDFLKD